MKGVLVLLFLTGCATAEFYDELDQVSNDLVEDFVAGMDDMPSLKNVLALEHNGDTEQLDHDIKNQLAKTLKELLNEIVAKIRHVVQKGQETSKELIEKAKIIGEKLREAGHDVSRKGQESVQELRIKIKEWLKNLHEHLGLQRRSLSDLVNNLLQEFDLKTLLKKLKEKLVEKVDLPAIVEYIKKVFGEFSSEGKALLHTVKTQGVASLKKLINALLDASENRRTAVRSTSQIAVASCQILKLISEDVNEEIIRDFINTNVQDEQWKNKFLRALYLGTSALQSVTNRLCLEGPIADLWKKVTDFFQGIGLGLKDKFSVFAQWLQGVMKAGWDKTKDKGAQLKEAAKTVIANGKTLTSAAAKQALAFFDEHKETIGKILWEQLKAVVIKAIVAG